MTGSPFPICDECGLPNASWELDGDDLCGRCYGEVKGYYAPTEIKEDQE